jgi:extracellular factor (EF) 3-hydroxypalmitic acid methyl ester biosynthesis protein
MLEGYLDAVAVEPSTSEHILLPLKQRFTEWVENGGPEPHEYEEITAFWTEVQDLKKAGQVSHHDLLAMWSIFGEEGLNSTLQGYVQRRPSGYHGDYQVIDLIYQTHIHPSEKYRRWDEYFQVQAAPKAVRNRKDYFLNLLEQVKGNQEDRLSVLNLASGPCRDVLEAFQRHGHSFDFHCVDLDPNAICYAQGLLGDYAPLVQFSCQNVIKYRTEQKYDLVWSAGLFDYLADNFFVNVLSRALSWAVAGGELVIGNFSPRNTTRDYMAFGGWELYHRSEDDLFQLALAAGAQREKITIDKESEGVNLFLRIRV